MTEMIFIPGYALTGALNNAIVKIREKAFETRIFSLSSAKNLNIT
jgi:hypothetical protein